MNQKLYDVRQTPIFSPLLLSRLCRSARERAAFYAENR